MKIVIEIKKKSIKIKTNYDKNLSFEDKINLYFSLKNIDICILKSIGIDEIFLNNLSIVGGVLDEK